MSTNEEIFELCNRLAQAHADKDADAIAACYAPEAVIYDLAPPLGRRGIDRDGLVAWLGTWGGPIVVDSTEVELSARDDMAYSTALTRMRGRKTGGEDVDLWFRTTMCFRKQDGTWHVVHEHTSVPFLMDGSDRAALDLVP